MPERFEGFWERLAELHPGAEFVTWTEPPEWIPHRDLYESLDPLAGRSDHLRYAVMAHEGGVYVDADVQPLRPFDDLLADDWPFMAWESDERLCPTVIGGPAGHPALQALVDELPAWVAACDSDDPVKRTGPEFVTATWRGRDDVRRLPPWTFYPVGPSERALLREPSPERSYAVHHWAAGWKDRGRTPGATQHRPATRTRT